MIRELGVHSTKYTPANMTAAVAMVTGMGAQISVADGNVILPAAEAASDIYFVEKERTVNGIYAAASGKAGRFHLCWHQRSDSIHSGR